MNENIQRQENTNSEFSEWELNDRTIMSWLLNSMEPSIVEGFMFLVFVQEIWESIVEIYSGK